MVHYDDPSGDLLGFDFLDGLSLAEGGRRSVVGEDVGRQFLEDMPRSKVTHRSSWMRSDA